LTSLDSTPLIVKLRSSTVASLPRSWKAPITLGIFAIICILLFIVFGRSGSTHFSFTPGQTGAIQLALLTVPTRATGIVVTVIAVLMALISIRFAYSKRKTPLWFVTIYAVVVLVGFLTWVSSGSQPLAVTGLLAGSLALATPLIFGALGGVVSERVGVVNVAIEGQLLAGAFVSAIVASVTQSLVLGVLSAMVAGLLVSSVLAAFSINYLVDQVIVGVVLNVLVLGLTSFFYSTTLTANAALNTPPSFSPLPIPVLSLIPVIGPVLFNQTIIVYLMYLAIAGVFYALFFTRWGLRVRSVGEHPQAADTVGINVARTRLWTVSLAGAIAGLGGAYYTLGSGLGFTINLTNGDGFIALAAVIFGRWNPIRATLAALMFGFAENLQYVIGENSPIPSQILLMLPYVVTIFAVAGLVGQVRAPAASGRPYVKS
jgi:ABC-type uncharacterized transport system permease subunit